MSTSSMNQCLVGHGSYGKNVVVAVAQFGC